MIPRASTLGPAVHRSPLTLPFVDEATFVLARAEQPHRATPHEPEAFEKAGPRARLFFRPEETTAAIVTAGGVCPGLNDVVRSLVISLRRSYGVARVLGFRFGFAGLDPTTAREPLVLEPFEVRNIHMRGGTVLGTSRGPRAPATMVDELVRRQVDVLFVVGGDGSMRAAHAIHEEIAARGARIGVVGIPKTIDNDIPFVDKTFGFETCIANARLAIEAAHAEASSVDFGVGLVKLMGRNAGFVAAEATLASHEVNACLVPEVPFEPARLTSWLEQRLEARRHAVLVVAEGCSIGDVTTTTDASGNRRFSSPASDVGVRLREIIEGYFETRRLPLVLKYIDPSYMLRASRAIADDGAFCGSLARNAVHAAMAGKTDLLIGRCHRVFTHVSLTDVLTHDKRLDPDGDLWREVLDATGQPAFT